MRMGGWRGFRGRYCVVFNGPDVETAIALELRSIAVDSLEASLRTFGASTRYQRATCSRLNH